MIPSSLSSLNLSTKSPSSTANANNTSGMANKRTDSVSSGIHNYLTPALNANGNGVVAPNKSPDLKQQQQQASDENHQFLKEVLTGVMEGQGVGWLKVSRVKRLMEDENYRNFVLARLNTSLDTKLASDEEHIEDVRVSRAVFKGIARILVAIVHGLEQTYANNGLGGMASAFQLLEIAHTHYYWTGGELNSTSGSATTATASGAVGNDGAMSPMSEKSGDSSPYDSKENLSQLTSTMSSSSSMHTGIASTQFQMQSTGNIVAQLGKINFIIIILLMIDKK